MKYTGRKNETKIDRMGCMQLTDEKLLALAIFLLAIAVFSLAVGFMFGSVNLGNTIIDFGNIIKETAKEIIVAL